MTRDERGLTLIEVLASLAILSFIGVTIWNVFLQGYNFSQKSMTKNTLLQEANLVTSNLKNIHQKSTEYRIFSTGSNCEITVEPKKNAVAQPTTVITNSNICISFEIKIDNVSYGSGPVKIEPNKNDATVIVTLNDRNNPTNKIIIDSYLYRVKGADYK